MTQIQRSRERVANNFRVADQRILSVMIFRPQGAEGIWGGLGVLILVVTTFLDAPFWGWQYLLPPIGWVQALPGSFVLICMGLAASTSSLWMSRLVREDDVTPWRRRVNAVAFAVPLINILYLAERGESLKETRAGSSFRHRQRRKLGRIELWLLRLPMETSAAGYITFTVNILVSLLGVIWITQPAHRTGYRVIPIILLGLVLHAAAAIALGSLVELKLRQRGFSRWRSWPKTALGAWAWLPAPVAFLFLLVLALIDSGLRRDVLMTYRLRLATSSVPNLVAVLAGPRSRRSQPAVSGSTTRTRHVVSFCRIQSFRLWAEGTVLGCLIAPKVLSTIDPVAVFLILSLALVALPLLWTLDGLLSKVDRRLRSQPLRRFVWWITAAGRLTFSITVLTLGMAWGLSLGLPRSIVPAETMLNVTAIAATFAGLGFVVVPSSTKGRSRIATLMWFVVTFFVAITGFIGLAVGPTASTFGIETIECLIVIAVLMSSSGPLIAWYFVPWMLKPLQRHEILRPALRHRHGWAAWSPLLTLLPFTGLLNVVWLQALERSSPGPALANRSGNGSRDGL